MRVTLAEGTMRGSKFKDTGEGWVEIKRESELRVVSVFRRGGRRGEG